MKKILSLLLLLHSVVYPGFVQNSLVKVADGYRVIQDIKIDDQVSITSIDGQISLTKVVATKLSIANRHVRLMVEGREICCAVDQQFYLTDQDKWVKAKELQVEDKLLTASGKVGVVEQVELIHKLTKLYDISLEEKHLFFVSDAEVVAHNFIPIVIGVAGSFGAGTIVIESVTVGVCIVGLWIGMKQCGNGKNKLIAEPAENGCSFPKSVTDQPYGCNYQNDEQGYELYGCSQQQEGAYVVEGVYPVESTMHLRQPKKPGCKDKPEEHQVGESCGGSNCKPRKGPYGYHIPSAKHPPKPVGNASPGLNTDEGQDALDVSVPVKDKSGELIGRITVWNGKIVVFKKTTDTPEESWHNYMPEWEKLRVEQKNALRKHGLVKNNDSGKIIKDMKNSKKKK